MLPVQKTNPTKAEFMMQQAFLIKCCNMCAVIAVALVFVQLLFLLVEDGALRWYKIFYFTAPAFVFLIATYLLNRKIKMNDEHKSKPNE